MLLRIRDTYPELVGSVATYPWYIPWTCSQCCVVGRCRGVRCWGRGRGAGTRGHWRHLRPWGGSYPGVTDGASWETGRSPRPAPGRGGRGERAAPRWWCTTARGSTHCRWQVGEEVGTEIPCMRSTPAHRVNLKHDNAARILKRGLIRDKKVIVLKIVNKCNTNTILPRKLLRSATFQPWL